MADSPDARQPGETPESLLADRKRLRQELEEARAEIMRLRCHAEVLREEWFGAKQQEQEFRKYIHKLTGVDPYLSPAEFLSALRNGSSFNDLITELEKETGASPTGA